MKCINQYKWNQGVMVPPLQLSDEVLGCYDAVTGAMLLIDKDDHQGKKGRKLNADVALVLR